MHCYSEGGEMNMLAISLFVSEAISHLSFAPFFHSPLIFLPSATLQHNSLLASLSLLSLLFSISQDVFLMAFCGLLSTVYETFKKRTQGFTPFSPKFLDFTFRKCYSQLCSAWGLFKKIQSPENSDNYNKTNVSGAAIMVT